ncbi:hypothetical protein ACQ4PT_014647 [Festuca glaucescens]
MSCTGKHTSARWWGTWRSRSRRLCRLTIEVPVSDLPAHLGRLLEEQDGVDIAFDAHKIVLDMRCSRRSSTVRDQGEGRAAHRRGRYAAAGLQGSTAVCLHQRSARPGRPQR